MEGPLDDIDVNKDVSELALLSAFPKRSEPPRKNFCCQSGAIAIESEAIADKNSKLCR